MRVTTVDDDVAFFQIWLELLDEGVDGGSSFYEEDDLTRSLEFRAKLLDGVSALDLGALRMAKFRRGVGKTPIKLKSIREISRLDWIGD